MKTMQFDSLYILIWWRYFMVFLNMFFIIILFLYIRIPYSLLRMDAQGSKS